MLSNEIIRSVLGNKDTNIQPAIVESYAIIDGLQQLVHAKEVRYKKDLQLKTSIERESAESGSTKRRCYQEAKDNKY